MFYCRRYRRQLAMLMFACLYAPFALTGVAFAANQNAEEIVREKNLYTKIANQYLPSIARDLEREEKLEKQLKEENAKAVQDKKMKDVKVPSLSSAQKISMMYRMLSDYYLDAFADEQSYTLNKSVYKDAELFCGTEEEAKSHLFSKIDRTQTTAGKIALQKMLFTPSNNPAEIQRRQLIVKELVDNEALFNNVDAQLNQIKSVENGMIWFWKELDEEVHKFFEDAYFKSFLFTAYNKDSTALELESRRVSTLMPFIMITWPVLGTWIGCEIVKTVMQKLTGDEEWSKLFTKDMPTHSGHKLLKLFYGESHFLNSYYHLIKGLVVDPGINTFIRGGNRYDIPFSRFQKLYPAEAAAFKAAPTEQARKDILQELKYVLGENNTKITCDKDCNISISIPWPFGTRAGAGALLLLSYFTYYKGVRGSVDPALHQNKIESIIHEKMNNVAAYLDSTRMLAADLKKSAVAELIPTLDIMGTQNVAEQEAQEMVKLLESSTFKNEPSYFCQKGNVLASFKMMFDSKKNLVPALLAAGEIDAYLSIAKLYKENAQHERAPYCFVNVVDRAEEPCLMIKDMWHPFIDQNKVVTNSVELGGTTVTKNMIVTGPNAGGKSTALKSIVVAVILAQALGIAPAQSMTLTPFTKISTYLNIADTEGKESLFQAEMRRAKELLHCIRGLNQDQFALSIMDEIFTGTNPQEGEAGAYGVAKGMSRFSNSIAVIATHYKKLTELEEVTDKLMKNFKVSVIEHENGKITPTYKIDEGISHQAIALQLLEQGGFDKEILDDAYAVFNQGKEAEAQKISAAEKAKAKKAQKKSAPLDELDI